MLCPEPGTIRQLHGDERTIAKGTWLLVLSVVVYPGSIVMSLLYGFEVM